MLYADLLPARYKNLNFYIKRESISGGIAKQYSTTPNLIKNRKVVDLVIIPTEISLDIYFTGQLASYTARKMLQLANEKTSGTLQIPTFGIFKNMVIKDIISITTDLKKVGRIETTITFLEKLDVETTTNLLSKLDDLTLKLQNLTDAFIDAFYFLSNLTEKVNTIKANINKVFNTIRVPTLLINDLSNSLKLKSFFNNQKLVLQNLKPDILEIALRDKQLQQSKSSNPIEQNQLTPINTLIISNKINQYVSYCENLKNFNFTTQDAIIDKMNNILTYQDNILYEDNLPIEIKDTLEIYINTLIDYLVEKSEGLPTIIEFEAVEESSLTITYRTLSSIDNVALIEDINNFEDLDYINGVVKCLKY